ncbi:ATP-binding protein [Streptomyces sp. R21]|uniref:ATP-binding protein n=1 Tax=Streptomyces sp. R21 TaxID=3238627 RepID=A0AB39P4J7_9ACTN
MKTLCPGVRLKLRRGITRVTRAASRRELRMSSLAVSLVRPPPVPRAWMCPVVRGVHGQAFHRWRMRPTLDSVPEVRARVRATLRRRRVPADVEDALLLVVTELASNAVRHADTDRLCAAITFGRGWLRLDVGDGDPALPDVGAEVDLESEGGRGLFLVGLLVTELRGEVAAIPCGSGKVVRVRVPLAG